MCRSCAELEIVSYVLGIGGSTAYDLELAIFAVLSREARERTVETQLSQPLRLLETPECTSMHVPKNFVA